MRQRLAVVAVLATALMAAAPSLAGAAPWSFVTRHGSQLTLDGKPFRFSGANIEWLGLVGYGPLNFDAGQNERFPSRYEVDDALATAREMGATVVRAQTLGDTVGCANCLEPALGRYNAQAFGVMDYAIMRARQYGIRLILEFQGDSRAVNGGNTSSVFSSWEGGKDFWTDPTVIADFEDHIKHVVDHVNSLTGVPYKDDPTILGWMDCNECSVDGAPDTWVTTINDYVKSLGPKQLIISNAPSVGPGPTELTDPNIDAFTAEVYPHWAPEVAGDRATGQDPWIHAAAAAVTAAGKAWFASEVGWDPTNWLTTGDLQSFLSGIEQDPNISGDLFWALEGHANGHGWTPVPANSDCVPSLDSAPPPSGVTPPPAAQRTPAGGAGCQVGEDGSWWALYYTGLDTASNTAPDMAARAQMLRAHAYAMQGLPVPRHLRPPAPIITQTAAGRLYWEGSAGAKDYSIQSAASASGPWKTVCDRCATDLSNGWAEPAAAACYRVIAYNLDGVAGPASATAGSGEGCSPLAGSTPPAGPPPSSSSAPCLPPPPTLQVPASSGLAADYNNVGISDDCDGAGDFDGFGDSYSAQALAKAGLSPGKAVDWDGFAFTWPDVAPSQPDNVLAAGQQVSLAPPKGATALGLLGSAAFEPVAGTATITYTDGTTQSVTLGFSDWSLNAGVVAPQYGNQVVAAMPYRNQGVQSDTATYLFGQSIPLLAGKTASSITLPTTAGGGQDGAGALHIFALAFASAPTTTTAAGSTR